MKLNIENMGNMRFKVGDRVRIKSIDWYNENKDEDGDVPCSVDTLFVASNKKYLGTIQTIERIFECKGRYTNNYVYHMAKIDSTDWTNEMIEGLVEDEFDLIPKFGEYSDNESLDIPIMTTEFVKEHGLPCPDGYIFKDENGNVINATKIVLEKKLDDKLKLESTKKVREYWSEYTRIFIEIYDDEPNECILTYLYTFEGHRQKGHAKKALTEAELLAKELGCHKAHLKVETNSWMYNWYLRCGYNWYKNANEGYTWLTKNL